MMAWNFLFFFNSICLGIGLAMDAFSVSLANGLHEPQMKFGRMSAIAGTYAGFQYLMPMAGWICVHTVLQYFKAFQKFIPWIALVLLLYIGGKMLIEAVKKVEKEEGVKNLSLAVLMIQGVATSIDALSVGFTIAEYPLVMALVCGLIIAIVTYGLCMLGLKLGKSFGTRFAGKAEIAGGVILILIGIEIFIKGVFF